MLTPKCGFGNFLSGAAPLESSIDMTTPETYQEIATELKQAQRVLVITGAGISAESGLPTYRGIGGLYNETDTEDEVPIEVALSGQMLRQRPALTWKYLGQIEESCRGAGFNRAHEILAQWEKRFPQVTVLTQNIDGFHLDAGSENVIEMHGNCRSLSCMDCDWEKSVPDYSAIDIPPECPVCGGNARPNVVLFGEMLPVDAVARLEAALRAGPDFVFSIGTTSVFPYIAEPVVDASRRGQPSVEINPVGSEVSQFVRYRLKAGAVEALEAIQRELE